MDLRDKIIKDMAEAGIESEDIISTVIADEFYHINKATHLYRTIELSGLGTFIFSSSKGKKALAKISRRLEGMTNPKHRQSAQELIDYIKSKI